MPKSGGSLLTKIKPNTKHKFDSVRRIM